MMIYWQSIISQHVSGVFTPIIRTADCMPLPVVSCPGYGCCGSGESGGEMCSPDDGRKDAQNTLRNNWLPINHQLLHLVDLAFICLSKMHEQSSIKFSAENFTVRNLLWCMRRQISKYTLNHNCIFWYHLYYPQCVTQSSFLQGHQQAHA